MLITESKLRQIVKEEYRIILEQDEIKAMGRIKNIKNFFAQAGGVFAEIVQKAKDDTLSPDLSGGEQVVDISVARQQREKSRTNLQNNQYSVPTYNLSVATGKLKDELVSSDPLASEVLRAIFEENNYQEPLKSMIDNLKNNSYEKLYSLFARSWLNKINKRETPSIKDQIRVYFDYFSDMARVPNYHMQDIRFGRSKPKRALRSAKPGEIDLNLIDIDLSHLNSANLSDIQTEIQESSLSQEIKDKFNELFGEVNTRRGGRGTSNDIRIPVELSRFLINKGVDRVEANNQLYRVDDGQPVE